MCWKQTAKHRKRNQPSFIAPGQRHDRATGYSLRIAEPLRWRDKSDYLEE